MTHPGPLRDARAERRRLLAAGRPESRATTHPDIVSLHDLATAYMRAHDGVLAPATIKGHGEAYRRSIAPTLGGLLLAGVTRQRVVAWLAELTGTHSAHGCWKALTALRTFLNAGVAWGIIANNAAAGLRLPGSRDGSPSRTGPRRVLAMAELDRLLAACTAVRTECMVRVSAEAGLRRGEVVGLRWGDLDLPGRRLTVARSVWQEAGRDGAPPVRHVKPPKSGRVKVVAISLGLAERLGDLYATSVIEAGADAAGYVFPGAGGGVMDASTPSQMLARACVRAGLVDADGAPLVSWHSLRHTAASLMLADGVPLPDVAAQLRHADPGITARVYSHSLGEDRQHAAASVFDALQTTRTVRETVRETDSERENPLA